MKYLVLSTIIATSALIISLPSQAQVQQPFHQQYHQNVPKQIRHYQAPKRHPLTEEIIKKRFGHQLAITKRQMAVDKKQAEVYAANFARYQKAQAEALKQMMAQSEKQRQMIIKRLEIQQQILLEQFSKVQISKDTK